MIIEDCVAIDRQLAILPNGLLKMQIVNTTEDIARHPMVLFELSGIAVNEKASDSQLYPVLALRRFFFRHWTRARFGIGRFPGV